IFGVTDTKVTPYDDKNAVRETWNAGSGFPLIILRNYDAELDAQVLTDLSVVQQGSAYTPPSGLVLDYQERKLDAVHSLRVQNRLEALPPQQNKYSTQMISFP